MSVTCFDFVGERTFVRYVLRIYNAYHDPLMLKLSIGSVDSHDVWQYAICHPYQHFGLQLISKSVRYGKYTKHWLKT